MKILHQTLYWVISSETKAEILSELVERLIGCFRKVRETQWLGGCTLHMQCSKHQDLLRFWHHGRLWRCTVWHTKYQSIIFRLSLYKHQHLTISIFFFKHKANLLIFFSTTSVNTFHRSFYICYQSQL